MSYRPNPGTECCPGNVNRFMPNFAAHMWSGKGDVICCNVYGASTYTGDGIEIEETTNYPFEESVSFNVKTERTFTLNLRIPEWVKAFDVYLNGEKKTTQAVDGYVSLQTVSACVIKLDFKTEIEKVANHDGVYFRKGVLVYSLGGKERRVIDADEKRSSKNFPAYNMYPDFEWRYAVEENCMPRFVSEKGDYYSEKCELPHLVIKARHLPTWDYIHLEQFEKCTNLYKKTISDVAASVTFTPPLPTDRSDIGDAAEIKLYPYGCCKLRITVFACI